MSTLLESQSPVWSKSQVSAFRDCTRKGFFSSRPKLVDGAARLKSLKNRHLWVGAMIHERIGDIIKTIRQGEPVGVTEDIIQKTKERMRAEFKDSKDSRPDHDRLFEHEYGVVIEPRLWQDHWSTVEKSLRWFLSSKWVGRFKEMGPEVWKAVDEVLSFDCEGVKTYVKIDCAIESGGTFFLMDWKSSVLRPEDESSLLVAALYAHDVWGADPDRINATAVCLLDGQSHQVTVNEDTLMETHLRIQDESAYLTEQTAGLNSDPFTIPMTANLNTCRRCNFQKLCHPRGL